MYFVTSLKLRNGTSFCMSGICLLHKDDTHDLGKDEASQGVQPRRLDLEDDVDPPQLMITGVQDKGEVNFPIMDTNKVMCEGT
jgi:hypothetical protein